MSKFLIPPLLVVLFAAGCGSTDRGPLARPAAAAVPAPRESRAAYAGAPPVASGPPESIAEEPPACACTLADEKEPDEDDARRQRHGPCAHSMRKFFEWVPSDVYSERPGNYHHAGLNLLTIVMDRCPSIGIFKHTAASPDYGINPFFYNAVAFMSYLEEHYACARNGQGPAATCAARRDSRLPHAWRDRGVTDDELCLDGLSYSFLLEMWKHTAGSDPRVDDFFVAALRDASYKAWDRLPDAQQRLCKRPAPSLGSP
jgi:hypothetical protein